MRFCSQCGSTLSQRVPEGDDRTRYVCDACGHIHYQNPLVVVGSVVTHGDRLLLCRRAIDPRKGFWTLPAGYMELGETVEEGAVREAWEEARARILITGTLAIYSVPRISQVQVMFQATLLDPAVAAGPESSEVALFDWDEIPWDELAFPTVTWALQRAMALRGQNGPLVTVSNPSDASLGGLP